MNFNGAVSVASSRGTIVEAASLGMHDDDEEVVRLDSSLIGTAQDAHQAAASALDPSFEVVSLGSEHVVTPRATPLKRSFCSKLCEVALRIFLFIAATAILYFTKAPPAVVGSVTVLLIVSCFYPKSAPTKAPDDQPDEPLTPTTLPPGLGVDPRIKARTEATDPDVAAQGNSVLPKPVDL